MAQASIMLRFTFLKLKHNFGKKQLKVSC